MAERREGVGVRPEDGFGVQEIRCRMLFDSEGMNHNFSLVRLGFGRPEGRTPGGALGFASSRL